MGRVVTPLCDACFTKMTRFYIRSENTWKAMGFVCGCGRTKFDRDLEINTTPFDIAWAQLKRNAGIDTEPQDWMDVLRRGDE
tara:strand:+ start:638 stop:883 length:246 start_codon:yes stop_codon:yes gene_type:complete